MNRIDLLDEAKRITAGVRDKEYGDPVQNHQRAADIFNAATSRDLLAEEVALMQICLKLSRVQGSPDKSDHYVDIMAYAGIMYECIVAGDRHD